MASYPATSGFAPQKGSYREPTQKTEVYIAGDGGGRVYVPMSKSRFFLKHTLDAADVTTITNLYIANASLPVDLVWIEDGATYSCYFDGQPDLRPDENGRWDATVKLVQA